jgi:hypothetical protein
VELGYQVVPIDRISTFQMDPIIESGPSKPCVVQLKSSRAYNPQFGSHSNAGSANVSRVLGNLWLVEHDVRGRFFFRIFGVARFFNRAGIMVVVRNHGCIVPLGLRFNAFT